jgi:hypothetical protein
VRPPAGKTTARESFFQGKYYSLDITIYGNLITIYDNSITIHGNFSLAVQKEKITAREKAYLLKIYPLDNILKNT